MGIFTRRYRAPHLETIEQFDALLDRGRPVLIDFWKHGCQPCRVMDGIVDEVAEEFQDRAIVVKAGLDRVPDLFARFKVKSTPTLAVVRATASGAHQRWRHSGLVNKDVIVDNLTRAVQAASAVDPAD